jgi:hypothetical protein
VIEAVVDANPNTIFMLETGNPVAMPWRDKVRAIIEWNPGQAGACAEILTGAVNPSGRLSTNSPADLAQTVNILTVDCRSRGDYVKLAAVLLSPAPFRLRRPPVYSDAGVAVPRCSQH